jgi:hypothetical protein
MTGYIAMAFPNTFSQLPPTMLYPHSDSHTPTNIFSYTQNTASPAPELPIPSAWHPPPTPYDSNNCSVAQPQLLSESNRKRHIESVRESRGDSLPTSPSKTPRPLKRPRNAVRETPAFACPLYKHNPSRFGGPRGCADWCTLEIHRLYSVR